MLPIVASPKLVSDRIPQKSLRISWPVKLYEFIIIMTTKAKISKPKSNVCSTVPIRTPIKLRTAVKTPAALGSIALLCCDLEMSITVMHAQKNRPKIVKNNPIKAFTNLKF